MIQSILSTLFQVILPLSIRLPPGRFLYGSDDWIQRIC